MGSVLLRVEMSVSAPVLNPNAAVAEFSFVKM